MSIRIFGYSTDTDSGEIADGYQLNIEIGRLVFQVAFSWRSAEHTVTPSSGCVYFDLNIACRKTECDLCGDRS
jgi:hypothetical protein